MDLLNKYFETLIFTFIEEKKGFGIYGAAVHGQIAGNKKRFILAFVPIHLAIYSSAKLSQLPWKNLQARLCPESTYRLKPQSWKFPYDLPNLFFRAVSREKGYTLYQLDNNNSAIDFPFEVLLINNPKKKSLYQYPNSTNLHWAIDQFSTVFNYVGTKQPIQLTSLPLSSSLSSSADYELI